MIGIELFIAGILVASVATGLLGSLAGLGGGVLIVPLLTIGIPLDIRLAIGASIVSVIATSSGAATSYVRDLLTNIRVAMLLERASSTGVLTGAVMAGYLNARASFAVFGCILLVPLVPTALKIGEEMPNAVGDSPSTAIRRSW